MASRRAAIVTGSSGGIGEAICLKLIENGFSVIGIDKVRGIGKKNAY